MPDHKEKNYHEQTRSAIRQTFTVTGPLTIQQLLNQMKQNNTAYQEIDGEKFQIDPGYVQSILDDNTEFVQDDTGRWHLAGE